MITRFGPGPTAEQLAAMSQMIGSLKDMEAQVESYVLKLFREIRATSASWAITILLNDLNDDVKELSEWVKINPERARQAAMRAASIIVRETRDTWYFM